MLFAPGPRIPLKYNLRLGPRVLPRVACPGTKMKFSFRADDEADDDHNDDGDDERRAMMRRR